LRSTTIRREYLDQTLFGTKAILNGSSTATRFTTTDIAATLDWRESRGLSGVVHLPIQLQTLTHTAGENTATGSFRPRRPLELQFDTHRSTILKVPDNRVSILGRGRVRVYLTGGFTAGEDPDFDGSKNLLRSV
jgi:hypothetical protein